jgi:peptide/nickel transport system substrate-binding protein
VKRSSASRFGALLSCLLLLPAACVTPPASTTPAAPEPTAAQSTRTVVVALDRFGKERMDVTIDSASQPYQSPMFDPFIGAGFDGKLDPALGVVKSWSPSADGATWTFTLWEGIKWHDGVEMTADDFKFTMGLCMREEALSSSCLRIKGQLDRVEVVDRLTAKVVLKRPNFAFQHTLGLEGQLFVLPSHYYKSPEQFDNAPLGSGPFKFVSRRLGEFIEFEANKQYWAPSRVPGFAKLRLILVPDPAARTAMINTGEADLAPVAPQQVPALTAAGLATGLGPKDTGSTVIAFFNSYDPGYICNKVEFRKALTLAIDMDAIEKAFYGPGLGARHAGAAIFTPGMPGYDPALKPYPYDPRQARQLLTQAKYDGAPIKFWSFTFPGNPEQGEVNLAIAKYWRDIGLNVDLVTIDFSSLAARFPKQEFKPPCELAVILPAFRPSGTVQMQTWFQTVADGAFTTAYWKPEKGAALIAKLTKTADAKEVDRLLRDFNREAYDEYWAIPIVTKDEPWVVGRAVADWKPAHQRLNFWTIQIKPGR